MPFTNANNYLSSVALKTTMQQYTMRVDHRISDNDNFFGRYTYFVNNYDNGTSSPWPDPAVRARYDNFETRNSTLLRNTYVLTDRPERNSSRHRPPVFPVSGCELWRRAGRRNLGFPRAFRTTVVPTITQWLHRFHHRDCWYSRRFNMGRNRYGDDRSRQPQHQGWVSNTGCCSATIIRPRRRPAASTLRRL